jgi:hypothetical protein
MPEADMASVQPDVRLRDQIDIDSTDAFNFLIGGQRVNPKGKLDRIELLSSGRTKHLVNAVALATRRS